MLWPMIAIFLSTTCFAEAAPRPAENWSRDARIPATGRPNPLRLPETQRQQFIRQGKIHALVYPVDVTGVVAPIRPMSMLIERQSGGLFGEGGMFGWLGLHDYPASTETYEIESPYAVPFPGGIRPPHRMGVTLMRREAEGFTLSCAACHSAELFGRPVLGLTNRFPRANEFFRMGKAIAAVVDPGLFQSLTTATHAETQMYIRLREQMKFIGSKKPEVLGLDTSLAHTAISLAHRADDEYATKDPTQRARFEPLSTQVADSKPAPWWNLKYKTRWLLDGSVVSGNPIYTNILWNEIGRGTDLHDLEDWLNRNQETIDELTAATFATEAPRFTDFFPAESISLAAAKKGEAVFNQHCARCHGTYEKAWSGRGSGALSLEDQLATVRVRYHERTPVIDVGTDPGRYLGMRSLAPALNRLAISKKNGILVEPQKGYVPPPLVGIWARWPYFHNNSAPTLCAVLTRSARRPRVYYAGKASNPDTDFDRECNGYPSGLRIPLEWRQDPDSIYNTARPGMHNRGHDEGIFIKNGRELLTTEQKRNLVSFLQTL